MSATRAGAFLVGELRQRPQRLEAASFLSVSPRTAIPVLGAASVDGVARVIASRSDRDRRHAAARVSARTCTSKPSSPSDSYSYSSSADAFSDSLVFVQNRSSVSVSRRLRVHHAAAPSSSRDAAQHSSFAATHSGRPMSRGSATGAVGAVARAVVGDRAHASALGRRHLARRAQSSWRTEPGVRRQRRAAVGCGRTCHSPRRDQPCGGGMLP